MPKNTKGGSKFKRNKTYVPKERKPDAICKDPNPEELEAYGKVLKAGGNRRFSVCCQKVENPDELTTITCKIKGSFRKRVHPDDYVLVKYYGFSEQAQIIDVYSSTELDILKSMDMWDFPDLKTVQKHRNEELDLGFDLSSGSGSESDNDDDNQSAQQVRIAESTDESDGDIDIDNI